KAKRPFTNSPLCGVCAALSSSCEHLPPEGAPSCGDPVVQSSSPWLPWFPWSPWLPWFPWSPCPWWSPSPPGQLADAHDIPDTVPPPFVQTSDGSILQSGSSLPPRQHATAGGVVGPQGFGSQELALTTAPPAAEHASGLVWLTHWPPPGLLSSSSSPTK